MTSEEIVLHDYLFSVRNDNGRPDVGRIQILKGLIAEMVKWGRTKRFLILFNQEFESEIGPLIDEEMERIQVEVDPKRELEVLTDFCDMVKGVPSQHPRIIFSVKAGLQFDQGFQVFKKNPKQLVRWVSDRILKPFQDQHLRRFHK